MIGGIGDVATTDNLIPGGLFATLVGLVAFFIREMVKDRGAGFLLATERKEDLHSLRLEYIESQKQCAEERLHHARDVAEREARHAHELSALQQDIFEQRKLKHDAIGRLATAELLLVTVRKLSASCQCGALDAVRSVLDSE